MSPITAIVQRNLLNYVRSKGRVFGALFMSMFMLVMFSFLMKSSMSGLDAPMNYLISGVIIMSVFQVSVNNSSDILTDISSGYMKEVLVAPIARAQISMGHILSGAVIATLQGVVTMICGIVLGLRVGVLQILLLAAVMLIAAMAFSAIGLFLATVSRNSPAFQTISSMIMMPLTFVSGAYIPTTMIPGFLLPIVYLNPLTYTTSIFRYIALGAHTLGTEELVEQGMAFDLGGFVITPLMGLAITLLIGAFFFVLCVRKFDRADFSTIKVAAGMRGGGAAARRWLMELQLEAVTKSYKSKQVLKGISLTMGAGVYGLLGPNGAGKTTMIRILADVLRPSKGRVLYGGRDIHAVGDGYRAKIGYLPQDVSFYGDFTGRDYLEYSAALKGMEKARAKQRIEELAHSVGLWDDLKRKCTAYSGGMQRRLGIAQALLDDPEILILDEPTSGLDPYERIRFRNIISAYAQDRLVLLSTHIVSDVEQIAAQIMMMEYGTIQHIHTGGEYVQMMEGRVWLAEMPAGQLVEYQNRAVISNVRAKDGCMEVRVIADTQPVPDAVQAVPVLEDAYLYLFNYLPGKAGR